ncbi:MAG: hypothetical protein BWY27_01122 [Bacteroidetes bacterium ADurb.Bin234]|nr:MAG: hypothetical protein BWY27_01122 [Bacteroidetes bacterium ADurb.Bin234]
MKDISVKNIIYIVIAAFILLIVIYFIGRSSGKAKSANQAKNPVYPQGGQGVPTGWSPVPIADALYKKMEGITINKPSLDALLLSYLTLPTDDMFVAVYSVFNQKYSSKGGTLRKWIEDEDYTVPIRFPDVIRPKIYARMDKLNLK